MQTAVNGSRVVVPLLIMFVVVVGVGATLLSLVLARREHRKAYRSGLPTMGSVGLAARIWAWQELLGYAAGMGVLAAFITAMVVLVATAPPPPPPKPKRVITQANFEAQPWDKDDSPGVMWAKTTPPGLHFMYDENYAEIFLITKDNLDPRDWPAGVAREVQKRQLSPPAAGYAYRTDTWELIKLPEKVAGPTSATTWRKQ